jgi:hypothetical protein
MCWLSSMARGRGRGIARHAGTTPGLNATTRL